MKRTRSISWFEVVRLDRGLSQRELAARMGVTQVYISQIERGEKVANPALAKRLAKALRCTVDDLFPPEGTAEPMDWLLAALARRRNNR